MVSGSNIDSFEFLNNKNTKKTTDKTFNIESWFNKFSNFSQIFDPIPVYKEEIPKMVSFRINRDSHLTTLS